MKKDDKCSFAGTEVQQSTKADVSSVSQPIAKPDVVGSLFKSREIKFRAWDGGKMFYSHNNSINASNFQNKWFFEKVREDAIIMQYTGLKDKNGKDIYEGDILNGRNRVLKIVYWCEKRAAFCESEQFKPIPAKHSFAKLYDKFGKVFNKNGRLENHFIVGNIFENSELLQVVR